MTPKISVIELCKETMKFSVAHFTIFSATERENLHGHNYTVYGAFKAFVIEDGLSFDYRFYKRKLYELCRSLNQTTLLPILSKYLKIEDQGDYYCVYFDQEKLFFLKRDVLLLPVSNITVEELSNWFIEQLLQDPAQLKKDHIQEIIIKVFSAPGQSGSATWSHSK